MKTDEGVHEQICNFISKADIKIDGKRILDWGCGTGALSQRLIDLGADVISIDIDSESFEATSKFIPVDFNDQDSFALFVDKFNATFDIVIASEVIEHVENPWAFIKSIKRVLKKNGAALISTPNTGSVLSRLNFLLTGNPHQFEESDLSYGHITPVSFLKMNVIFKDTGLTATNWASGGCLPLIWLGFHPKFLMFTFISLTLRWFMKGQKDGWCLMFIARNN